MDLLDTQTQRTILHIDMNAFFASVEQTANPFIRYKPVGVGGGGKDYDNSALVAISYEAKRAGVTKFMRAHEARAVCPQLIVVPTDFIKYYSINRQIIAILKQYTPLVEVYSVDEAFLDLTPVLHLSDKTPTQIAQEIKDRIRSEVGEKLTSSIGIGPNKLLAKVGSNWKKPDGLTEITWDNRFEYLDKLTPLQSIWGIGFRGGEKLARLGFSSTRQLREASDETLRSIVGSYYTRLRILANGESYEPVDPGHNNRLHKSMQHAHTMSTPTNDRQYLKTVIRKMAERLAARLRKEGQGASTVYLGLRPEKMKSYGWGSLPSFNGFEQLHLRTHHGKDIYSAACSILDSFQFGDAKIRLVAVGVHHLQPLQIQMFEIFRNPKQDAVDMAFDEINRTYGGFTIRTADILHQKAKETELSIVREDMTFHPAGAH